ncbi:MAG: endonuclease/exonuclease/phosphatase family protein [Caldilineaceae bacterium]
MSLLMLWIHLNRTVGDGVWWLALLNYGAPYLFLPALPLGIATAFIPLRRRRFNILFTLGVPALFFLLLYWPYVLPQRPATAIEPTHPTLTVMTYNVLYSNEDIDSIASVIQTHQPDLIALQEVQPTTMAALQQRLQANYPHTFYAEPHPYGTTAILSRYPFSDTQILELEADRTAALVTVTVQGQPITFVSAHLLAFGLRWVPWQEWPRVINERITARNHQAEILVHTLTRLDHPVILGCDCNSKVATEAYHILNSYLQNSVRQVGWWLGQRAEGTYADRNLQHTDYIFYRENGRAGETTLQPIRAYKMTNTGGSDHAPLVVEFATNQN